MKKTIRIDNLEDVKIGDMLFVKGRSDGFHVVCVRACASWLHVAVDNPSCNRMAYVSTDRFDHAERKAVAR
jgi:hypothetical protein